MRSLTKAAGNTLTDLHNWSVRRWLIVAVVSVTLSGVMTAVLGVWVVAPVTSVGNLGAAAPWWTYAIASTSVVLVAMTVASYVGAPPGAAATFCDLRWPVFGLIGVMLAIDSTGQMSGLFGSSPIATFSQPILGVLALVLLAWALARRMTQERAVITVSIARDTLYGGTGETCTTCRPLFAPHSLPPHDRRSEGDLSQ